MFTAFERHNDAVMPGVPKERLLKWSTSDGWEPICDRLGCPSRPRPSRSPTPLRSSAPVPFGGHQWPSSPTDPGP